MVRDEPCGGARIRPASDYTPLAIGLSLRLVCLSLSVRVESAFAVQSVTDGGGLNVVVVLLLLLRLWLSLLSLLQKLLLLLLL